MKAPKISVILGTKNRPQVISRALDSLLAQTFTDFECLIIDSSDDRSIKKIISEYDERFVYKQLIPDPGRVQSLNQAITMSRGKYITFLDDDDEFLPRKLELQSKYLDESGSDIGLVYSWAEIYDDKMNKVTGRYTNNIQGDVHFYTLSKMSLCSFISLMFKKDALQKVGLLSGRVNYPSDWELVCRFTKNYDVGLIPEILVRIHKNHLYEQMSVPRSKTRAHFMRSRDFHLDFLEYFKESYTKYPEKQLIHLIPLIKSFGILGDIHRASIYFWYALKINPFQVKIYRSYLAALYHNFRRSY